MYVLDLSADVACRRGSHAPDMGSDVASARCPAFRLPVVGRHASAAPAPRADCNEGAARGPAVCSSLRFAMSKTKAWNCLPGRAVRGKSTRTLEFFLAVPGRRHGDFVELLQPLQAKHEAAPAEVIDELRWKGHCLVVAHNPERAQVQTQRRQDRITTLVARAQTLAGTRSQEGRDRGALQEPG